MLKESKKNIIVVFTFGFAFMFDSQLHLQKPLKRLVGGADKHFA